MIYFIAVVPNAVNTNYIGLASIALALISERQCAILSGQFAIIINKSYSGSAFLNHTGKTEIIANHRANMPAV